MTGAAEEAMRACAIDAFQTPWAIHELATSPIGAAGYLGRVQAGGVSLARW
jgi:hypothetical protein